jgi:hypothetical protein
MGQDLERGLAQKLGKELGRGVAQELGQDIGMGLAQELGQDLGRGIAQKVGQDFGRGLAQEEELVGKELDSQQLREKRLSQHQVRGGEGDEAEGENSSLR